MLTVISERLLLVRSKYSNSKTQTDKLDMMEDKKGRLGALRQDEFFLRARAPEGKHPKEEKSVLF